MADGLAHARKCKLTTVTAQIDGSHTDFGVLITEANLPSEIFDADGSNPAQNGGGDLRFGSSDGLTLYAADVVSFVTDNDPANGTAEIHVSFPNVRDTQTDDIYVFYNTPGTDAQPAVGAANGRNAVWSGIYGGVWHLNTLPDNSTNDVIDSSGNGNDGQGTGFVSGDLVDGPFGKALNFDSNVVEVADATEIDDDTDFTTIVVFKADAWGNDGWLTRKGATHRFGFTGGTDLRAESSGTDATYAVSNLSLGTWYVAQGEYSDTNNLEIWIDGTSVATSNGTKRAQGSAAMFIGGQNSGSNLFDGQIAEVRVAPSSLGGNYAATLANSLNNPGSFITVGTPEDVGGGATTRRYGLSTLGVG